MLDPWIAHLAPEFAQADLDKLDLPAIAELLTTHRAGCQSSRLKLIAAMRWLVYEADNLDLSRLSSDYDAISRAVDRLRPDPKQKRTKGPRITAEEVEEFVRAELKRSYFRFRREESSNIRPPASTRTARKARLKQERVAKGDETEITDSDLGEIKRDWKHNTVSGLAEEIHGDDGPQSTWLDEQPTKRQRTSMDILVFELREHVARTSEEEAVLDCLTSGLSFAAIAHELGISKYKVETIVALIRRRASDL
jgi:hypothetical protein